MKIRLKMFLVILPLVIVPLVLAQSASYFNAVNGVSRLARQLLGFKLDELEKFANLQWMLLLENNFSERPVMIEAAKRAVEQYGRSILLSDSEIIFAIDNSGSLEMRTSNPSLQPEETEELLRILK